MKCDYCGVVHPDGADYCRGCGKQLDNNQNEKEGNVPVNEKKNVKKTPLNELENKREKWSYCIVVLTVCLIFACFYPFFSVDTEADTVTSASLRWFEEYGEMDLYDVSLVQFLKMNRLLIDEIYDEIYIPGATFRKAVEYSGIGALLILILCVIAIICTVKRKRVFPVICVIPLTALFIIDCCRSNKNMPFYHYVLGYGAYIILFLPAVIFAISIRQYWLDKKIKEYILCCKAKGIMEYTADDFIPCPFCNQNEFVRDAGHCRNCGAEFDCGARNRIFFLLAINVILNIFAAIMCSDSYWITMFDLHIADYYNTEMIDNVMAICYWILAAGFLVIAVLPFKQRKVLKFAFPVLSVIMSSIQAVHIRNLSEEVPTRYEYSTRIALVVVIIVGLMELVMILRNLKKAESYFGKK